MDDYLDWLFSYLLETRLDRCLQESGIYLQAAEALQEKAEALEARLDGEQKALLDDFCSAESHLLLLEEQTVFREAVALGKWMAR